MSLTNGLSGTGRKTRRPRHGSWLRLDGEVATTVLRLLRKSRCTRPIRVCASPCIHGSGLTILSVPAQTPVPTLDPAMLRLTQALTKLTTSHAGNTKSLMSLGDEHASLEQQETRLRQLVTEAEEKRAWFDGFRQWMDSLADFLDEKVCVLLSWRQYLQCSCLISISVP